MNNIAIAGLQKLSLVDYPGRIAATVFLSGCQMRCPFCHNSELTQPGYSSLSEPQLLQFLEKRKTILDGVVITGGEPTLQPIRHLIETIKQIGYPIKLDTNGQRPELTESLWREGLLDYVAMDVKNCPARYGETAGVPGLDVTPFRESVSFLLQGTVDYEFRTTVVREFHDADSFKAIGPWIAGAKRYFLQSFVDRDTVLREGLHPWDGETLGSFADLVRPYVEQVELRGV